MQVRGIKVAQMKMRTKITGGFMLMLALLLSVSVVAVLFLNRGSTDFIQYRGWATDSNLMNDVQENMLMVRMSVKDFLIRGDLAEQENFDKNYAEVEAL